MDDRAVGDFYDEPGMAWSLRSVGTHLHPGSEEATVALAAHAAEHGFATSGRIVEIASALGAPARFVARRFADVVICIDMDRRMHAAATLVNRQQGLHRVVQPVLALAQRLPVASQSCDGAWSQDALCHMDKDAVLAEVARALRPGAVLAFTDFIARAPLTADELAALKRLWAFPSLLTIGGYVALLDRLGFEVLLAADRTGAVLGSRPRGLPDDEDWWHDFNSRWGEAAARDRLEVGLAWQSLLQQERTGYGLFVARRRVAPSRPG